jgi:hypothetical protein
MVSALLKLKSVLLPCLGAVKGLSLAVLSGKFLCSRILLSASKKTHLGHESGAHSTGLVALAVPALFSDS